MTAARQSEAANDKSSSSTVGPVCWPAPKSVTTSGSAIKLGPDIRICTDNRTDAAALLALTEALRGHHVETIVEGGENAPVEGKITTVHLAPPAETVRRELGIGTAKDLSPEGYALTVGVDGDGRPRVVIEAADGAGQFYAVQTLRELIESGESGTVPAIVVRDEPTVDCRGVIEGFYGKPWTHDERIDLLVFAARLKLNEYQYAPKDDPYHRERWQEKYPPKEIAELAELVRIAAGNHIRFTYALSPGLSIRYTSEEDLAALIAKLRQLWDVGVRSFSIPLDDIDPTDWKCAADTERFGSNPEGAGLAQAHLLNAVKAAFIDTEPTAHRLQTVATEYYDVDETPYKKALRENLDASIFVQWTGTAVIPPRITESEAAAARKVFGHEMILWDNYPVNDPAGAWGRLMLGPWSGRESGIAAHSAGILANPMNQAGANKIALFQYAAFAWNPSAADPADTWRAAINRLAAGNEELAEALTVFADIHHYSRELELPAAPALAAEIAAFWREYAAESFGADTAYTERVRATLRARFTIMAGDTIRQQLADPHFLNAADAWLTATAHAGRAGLAALDLLTAVRTGDGIGAWVHWQRADAEAAAVKALANPYRPKAPIMIADGVLDEFLTAAGDEHARSLDT